jgi:hypothetical protein
MPHSPLKQIALTLAAGLLAAALTAAPGAADDAGKLLRARGKVTAVRPEAGQLTLRTLRGQELTLHVDQRSRLRQDDRDLRLNELKEGMQVRVTYRHADGKNHLVALSEGTPSAEAVRKEVREALDAIKSYTLQQKEEYARKLSEMLDDLNERIDDLKERAEAAGAQAKKEYAPQLQELQRKRDEVSRRLERVRQATPGAWEEIKQGVSSAVEDLQKALERAGSRLQNPPPAKRP